MRPQRKLQRSISFYNLGVMACTGEVVNRISQVFKKKLHQVRTENGQTYISSICAVFDTLIKGNCQTSVENANPGNNGETANITPHISLRRAVRLSA